MLDWASGLLLMLGAYLGAGAVFALGFAIWGAARIDPAAHGMPISARLLLVPGAAALWPLLLWKCILRQPPPVS